MFHRRRRTGRFTPVVLAALMSGVAACDSSLNGPAPNLVSVTVSGVVRDLATRPLSGASIQFTSSGGPYLMVSTTGDGAYTASVSGPLDGVIQAQASLLGFSSHRESLPVNGAGTVIRADFILQDQRPTPIDTPVVTPGEYTITFSVDPACTAFPPEARSRAYDFSVSGPSPSPNGLFNVQLRGATLLPFLDRLTIDTVQDSINVRSPDPSNSFGIPEGLALTEAVPDGSHIQFFGTASLREELTLDDGATAALYGSIDYCPAGAGSTTGHYFSCVSRVSCFSSAHQVALMPR